MEETGTTEAGTAPVTATAEAQGQVSTTATDNTAGAAPATESAEVQDGQNSETTSTEGVTDATEGSDKGAHQTTLEERFEQIITKEKQKLREEFQQVTQAKVAEKPNFVPDLDMGKVNQHFIETMDQIEALKVEGRILEAMDLQDGLNATRQEIRQNEQRKAEWMQKTQAERESQDYEQNYNKALDAAAAFYFPKKGYTPEVIEKGREFFIGECQKDALLAAKYREIGHIQGPLAAMEFAESHIVKNMGAPQQALIDKKEAAKQTLPPGKTSTGVATGSADLAALRTKAGSGNAEDLAAYMAAKATAAT